MQYIDKTFQTFYDMLTPTYDVIGIRHELEENFDSIFSISYKNIKKIYFASQKLNLISSKSPRA